MHCIRIYISLYIPLIMLVILFLISGARPITSIFVMFLIRFNINLHITQSHWGFFNEDFVGTPKVKLFQKQEDFRVKTPPFFGTLEMLEKRPLFQ